MSAKTVLRRMNRVKAVEYDQAGYRIVQMTQPDQTTARIVRAVGIRQTPILVASERLAKPSPLQPTRDTPVGRLVVKTPPQRPIFRRGVSNSS